MPDKPEDDDVWESGSLRREFSHRGRVTRVIVALALTAIGWLALFTPYIGYACPIAFAPAALLLAFALSSSRWRRLRFALLTPVVLGLGWGLLTWMYVPDALFRYAPWSLGTVAMVLLDRHVSAS